MGGREDHVEEDHVVRGHELALPGSRDAAGLGGEDVVRPLPVHQDALRLHPLDLEHAVVVHVGDLPEPRGVGDPHDGAEEVVRHGLENLDVPVVAVRVAQDPDDLVRGPTHEARCTHGFDGVRKDCRGNATPSGPYVGVPKKMLLTNRVR